MTHASSGKGQAGTASREFMFIMRNFDSAGDYKKMICAFNHRHFFKPNEIYSPKVYTTSYEGNWYDRVMINKMEGVFQNGGYKIERVNSLWNTLYNFITLSDRQFYRYFDISIFSL